MPGIEGTAGFQPIKFGDTSSLQRNVIDRAIKVPDLATTAAFWVMKELDPEHLACGPTTALAFVAGLSIAAKEKEQRQVRNNTASYKMVLLRSDPWTYYASSYYNLSWVDKQFERHGGLAIFNCWRKVIRNAYNTGTLVLGLGKQL
ncbi:Pyridoxal-phosphate dependent enzyme family protein [Aphelenchoides avenae]|nr:Pyridoxal-phosphate dependent enzyme family protein [Aphelenchus avenae]